MMSSSNHARKNELIAQIGQGSIDQHVYEELMQLNQAAAQAQKERQQSVENVIKTIKDFDIHLHEIRSAFSAAELRGGAPTKAAGGRKKATRVTQRSGAILIADVKTASGKGAASNYHRGQKIPQYVPKAFKELYQSNTNDFESALARHFTAAGKDYFATAEGQSELAAWVGFVKTKPLNPRQS